MMRRATAWIVIVLVSSLAAGTARSAENQLTAEEKADGWQLLFNGVDHTGWKCSNGKPIATPIDEHALLPYRAGGYLIVYEKPFADFILKCDVKWEADHCNSGIFFRIEDLRNPVHTGFEVQVASGRGVGRHAFGAVYELAGTTTNAGKPTGEWNQVEIRCQGPHISVKLNGQEVASMNCDEFDQPGKCPDGKPHKFKLDGQPRAVKDFARAGYIGFQDHGQKVWFRNVKLLELK